MEFNKFEQEPQLFCNEILRYGCDKFASDIHIEIYEQSIKIRYRMNGVFVHAPIYSVKKFTECSARFKVLGGMRTDIHAFPQDGRFKYSTEKQEVDIRVSVMPVYKGECFVFRLLRQQRSPPSLIDIGYSEVSSQALQRSVSQTQGLILITGPTGSGKTTTLYSMVHLIDKKQRSLVTIEDPIEYVIEDARQTQINPKNSLTFVSGLRALLRQDPDVIVIGEIRDHETAAIATSAALTGHLVISTLHTQDAPGALTRLLNLGIDSHILASTLLIVVNQRLVRKLCRGCAEKGYKGCESCFLSGYQGRTVVHEELIIEDSIRKKISDKTDYNFKKAAIASGYVPLDQRAKELIDRGITTVEEVNRVLGEK